MTAQFSQRYKLAMASFCLAFLSLLPIACVKVRPSAYQLALQRYYRGLLAGSGESELRACIQGLTEDLKKDAADPGLHFLRTSARLELLRLGAQATPPTFNAVDASDFFQDLRQTQSVLDQTPSAPLWMRARVPTMFGDVLLLQAIAISDSPTEAPEMRVRRQIVLLYLYQLAGDWFLHASAVAGQLLADSEPLNKPGLNRELDNARDGYVNALSGMAQSERFLQLSNNARDHLTAAQNLLATAAPLPNAGGILPSPSSFYAYPHSRLAIQARALEELTSYNIPSRIQLRGTAIKEEIASSLLSNPMKDIGPANLSDSNLLALYLSSLTLEVARMSLNATGNANTESVSFTIRPNATYRSAGLVAQLPFLNVQIGDETRILKFPDTAIGAPFTVPATESGLSISISTGNGADAPPSTFFLGRTVTLLSRGKQIVIKGPGDYTITTSTIP